MYTNKINKKNKKWMKNLKKTRKRTSTGGTKNPLMTLYRSPSRNSSRRSINSSRRSRNASRRSRNASRSSRSSVLSVSRTSIKNRIFKHTRNIRKDKDETLEIRRNIHTYIEKIEENIIDLKIVFNLKLNALSQQSYDAAADADAAAVIGDHTYRAYFEIEKNILMAENHFLLTECLYELYTLDTDMDRHLLFIEQSLLINRMFDHITERHLINHHNYEGEPYNSLIERETLLGLLSSYSKNREYLKLIGYLLIGIGVVDNIREYDLDSVEQMYILNLLLGLLAEDIPQPSINHKVFVDSIRGEIKDISNYINDLKKKLISL